MTRDVGGSPQEIADSDTLLMDDITGGAEWLWLLTQDTPFGVSSGFAILVFDTS